MVSKLTGVATLAKLIAVHAPYDGVFELRVPGVYAIRVSRPNAEVTHAIQRSSVCIVAQGAKSVGRRVGYLSPSQFSREYGRFFGTAPTKTFTGCAKRALGAFMSHNIEGKLVVITGASSGSSDRCHSLRRGAGQGETNAEA
jgi:AraC-like DNA-binding protein